MYHKIEYCPYTLESSTFSRKGALLKVHFAENLVGFADCHPWEQLGDAPLESQLDGLGKHQLTSLTSRSLFFAQLDAQARGFNKRVMDGLVLPKSHFLVPNILHFSLSAFEAAKEQGFDYFKVKVGNDLFNEAKQLNNLFKHQAVRLRLDFNLKIARAEFERFLHETHSLHALFDFIEDPCPYNEESWAALQSQYQISLACDHHVDLAAGKPDVAAVLIIKPAVNDYQQLYAPAQRQIVTSYLDHPLGQVMAAWTAARMDTKSTQVHGLNSHFVYKPTIFSRCLCHSGPSFKAPEGTGFGFNDQLQGLSWKTVK